MQITSYAGAADAAGAATAHLDSGQLTAADLLDRLGDGNDRLAGVLPACCQVGSGTLVVDRPRTIAEPEPAVLPYTTRLRASFSFVPGVCMDR